MSHFTLDIVLNSGNIKFLHGLVKVSTGILKVEKLSDADRQTANLNINADNDYELALAA